MYDPSCFDHHPLEIRKRIHAHDSVPDPPLAYDAETRMNTRRYSAPPHPEQNFAPTGFVLPHFPQATKVPV
jgi:hypothetical protein